MSTEKELREKVGKKIRELRLKQGLSQEDLYKLTGINNTTISAYEHANKPIGLSNLTSIADGLGVTIDVLIYGDEDEAHINKAGSDTGKRIMNSIYALYKDHVFRSVRGDYMDQSTTIEIIRHPQPIFNFIKTISRIGADLSNPTPEQRLIIEDAKELAVREINFEIEREKKRAALLNGSDGL